MKKLFGLLLMLVSIVAQGKLSDQQSMRCINADKSTRSVFQDLQAAYEMRIVTAKDFFRAMDKAASCPQLRKDLKKLHASAVSSFPSAPMSAMPESDSSDDFSDFR